MPGREPLIDPDTRRAALIATAVTAPLLVIGLIFLAAGGGSSPSSGTSSSGPLPAVTVSAPPSTDGRTVSLCAQVISALPLTLVGQDLRRTVSNPSSPSIVAWGNPAIVLRCGVARPATLKPGSTDQLFSALGEAGPFFELSSTADANVYTFVDRAVYLDLSVPGKYSSTPVPPIARAIAKVLPAVCKPQPAQGEPAVPTNQLCAHRS